jgi:hypothetical protein
MNRKYFVWTAYALVALGLIGVSSFAGITLAAPHSADAHDLDTQHSPAFAAPNDTTARSSM